MDMQRLLQIRHGEGPSLTPERKEELLVSRLAEIPSLVVALSGGADSAYLAWAANRGLDARALSVTAVSPSFSAHDREMVEQFVAQIALRHEFIETHEMENPAYRANQPDRCYFCKDELFSVLDKLALARGFAAIAYGVNADDTLDFRPGHRAATEHQVLAPLLDARLTKSEIRALSRRAGLPTWDRPASACLASRVPYGTEVTPERLALIERGEAVIVGVNRFRMEERKIPTFRLDPALERAQTERLRALRAGRDNKLVAERLQRLEQAARAEENLMPLVLDAAAGYATLGEISDGLKAVFGEYREAA